MWSILFLFFVSFSSCCYIVLKEDKQRQDKYEFQGTSWRALCPNLHPVHHQEIAFHFYISVSVNPPTLQSYKIIHIYVTQNSASSYMSIRVNPCLPWVAVNLLPGQNHFHLLWEFMPFVTTVEQRSGLEGSLPWHTQGLFTIASTVFDFSSSSFKASYFYCSIEKEKALFPCSTAVNGALINPIYLNNWWLAVDFKSFL